MSAARFDSNVWVALTFDKHPFHETARAAFRKCKAKSPAVFCRATEQSFLRLASTPALHAAYECIGLNNHDVSGFLEGFHKLPHVIFAAEPATTRNLWLTFANAAGGKRICRASRSVKRRRVECPRHCGSGILPAALFRELNQTTARPQPDRTNHPRPPQSRLQKYRLTPQGRSLLEK